jgi:DNA repair exonuclease SbcCD nuclease subunit
MWLLIGDLHFTDRASDSYRFEIFDWIRKQQAKHTTVATFLAGDITNSKDRHSATLVNKIVSGLMKLEPPVYVVMGNHDYKDPKNPFFKFLNHIDGLKFITKPTVIEATRAMAVIPHYRSQDEFDAAVHRCAGADPDCFLVHQTFDGAIAESGVRLSGLRASPIESLEPPLGVYAGDVHRPQTQGIVTYLGCPYQVRFGDNFEPRALWVDKNGNETDLIFPAPRKWSLVARGPENILNNESLMEGDQVKLTIEVAREEMVDWKKIKSEVLTACKKLKLDVYGVKLQVNTLQQRKRVRPDDNKSSLVDVRSTFEEFCKAEKLSTTIRRVGREFIDGN